MSVLRLFFKYVRGGFSLVELMVSVAILTLLSTATVFSLTSTRQTEELRAAARLLEGDIRSVETRALAGENIQACPTASGSKVCAAENPSVDVCTGPCVPTVPLHFGIHIERAMDTNTVYTLFADLDGDLRLTSDQEIIVRRALNPLGGANKVIVRTMTSNQPIDQVQTLDLSVTRQSGTMRANACGDAGLPACSQVEATAIQVLLQHLQSSKEAAVDIDTRVGRVSFTL